MAANLKELNEMDKNVRATFDKMQKKVDKPDCFGKWESSDKCSKCWYHPDCKIVDPKKIQKEKAAAEKAAKKEIAKQKAAAKSPRAQANKKAKAEKALAALSPDQIAKLAKLF